MFLANNEMKAPVQAWWKRKNRISPVLGFQIVHVPLFWTFGICPHPSPTTLHMLHFSWVTVSSEMCLHTAAVRKYAKYIKKYAAHSMYPNEPAFVGDNTTHLTSLSAELLFGNSPTSIRMALNIRCLSRLYLGLATLVALLKTTIVTLLNWKFIAIDGFELLQRARNCRSQR